MKPFCYFQYSTKFLQVSLNWRYELIFSRFCKNNIFLSVQPSRIQPRENVKVFYGKLEKDSKNTNRTLTTHDAVALPCSFVTEHSYLPASSSFTFEMKRLPAGERLYFIDFVNVRPSFFHLDCEAKIIFTLITARWLPRCFWRFFTAYQRWRIALGATRQLNCCSGNGLQVVRFEN